MKLVASRMKLYLSPASCVCRIAIKFDTPRACVPSRTLMAQATAVPAELLSATEMDILVGLRFDVLNGSMVARE